MTNLSRTILFKKIIFYFSALFANVVSLNSTASNSSVPFGLWAIPELPQLTNFSLPNLAGRRKRNVFDNSLIEDVNTFQDFGISQLYDVLNMQNKDTVVKGFKRGAKFLTLMDDNPECQAFLGCRYQSLNLSFKKVLTHLCF